MKVDVSTITQDEAFDLLYALSAKFGWAGPLLYTRGDVEAAIEREITEEEWDRVQEAYGWRKFQDCAGEGGWETIMDAIADAGLWDDE